MKKKISRSRELTFITAAGLMFGLLVAGSIYAIVFLASRLSAALGTGNPLPEPVASFNLEKFEKLKSGK